MKPSPALGVGRGSTGEFPSSKKSGEEFLTWPGSDDPGFGGLWGDRNRGMFFIPLLFLGVPTSIAPKRTEIRLTTSLNPELPPSGFLRLWRLLSVRYEPRHYAAAPSTWTTSPAVNS